MLKCLMYGLSFPVVSIKLKAILLFARRKSVGLGSNRSWEGHLKKSGSLLVNHQFRDLLKIVFCLFENLDSHAKNYNPIV